MRSSLDVPAEAHGDVVAWHVTMRPRIDRVLATRPAGFRTASRVIVEQGAPRGLVVHRVVDTHVHALLACSRIEAGRFARSVGRALGRVLALPPFEPARFTAILDLRHLYRTFFYVLRQA